MGLLARLFGPRNLTAHWRARPELVPELDFDRLTFCGVSFGAPMDSFEMLGPAGNPRAILQGSYSFPEQGIRLEAHEGGFDHVDVYLDLEGASFKGRFSRGGLPLELTHETGPVEIIGIFGEPDERTTNDWGDYLVYIRDRALIGFSHDEDGRLEQVMLSVDDRADGTMEGPHP
jgi:hypothetical protein